MQIKPDPARTAQHLAKISDVGTAYALGHFVHLTRQMAQVHGSACEGCATCDLLREAAAVAEATDLEAARYTT